MQLSRVYSVRQRLLSEKDGSHDVAGGITCSKVEVIQLFMLNY